MKTTLAESLLELAEAIRTCPTPGALLFAVPPSLTTEDGWARTDLAVRFSKLPATVRFRALVEDLDMNAIRREVYP